VVWRALQDALLGTFGALTGPEPVLYYRKPDAVPGARCPARGALKRARSRSRTRAVSIPFAVPAHRVDEVRALLRRAGNSFDQRVMYLEVGGYAEFLEVRPEDGFLEG